MIALVKPQFEVGRARVGKGGIVRDEAARTDALTSTAQTARNLGYQVVANTTSPITGGKGNIEFLLHLLAPASNATLADVVSPVRLSWRRADTCHRSRRIHRLSPVPAARQSGR